VARHRWPCAEGLTDDGVEKRAAAQKAEADFFALLKESGIATLGAVWKDVGPALLLSLPWMDH
jgi:hypothetical protein